MSKTILTVMFKKQESADHFMRLAKAAGFDAWPWPWMPEHDTWIQVEVTSAQVLHNPEHLRLVMSNYGDPQIFVLPKDTIVQAGEEDTQR